MTQAEVVPLIGGLESALTAVEIALINEVFGENLPLLGNKLSQVAGQALPALHQVTGLKDAVKNGLAVLNGSPTYTKAQVEQDQRRAGRHLPLHRTIRGHSLQRHAHGHAEL